MHKLLGLGTARACLIAPALSSETPSSSGDSSQHGEGCVSSAAETPAPGLGTGICGRGLCETPLCHGRFSSLLIAKWRKRNTSPRQPPSSSSGNTAGSSCGIAGPDGADTSPKAPCWGAAGTQLRAPRSPLPIALVPSVAASSRPTSGHPAPSCGCTSGCCPPAPRTLPRSFLLPSGAGG